MTPTESRIYRLSPNQLRALYLLAKTTNGIIASVSTSGLLKKEGKALGGVFSALSRQTIQGEHLVLPWGMVEGGHGLKWKLNEKLITNTKLLQITGELLNI